jgi:hypothetical protein
MILTGILVASVGGSIFAAKKLTAKQDRVVTNPVTRVSLAKEHQELAGLLMKTVDRMLRSKTRDVSELNSVVNAFITIVRSAWPKGTYYDKKNVSAFISVLEASSSFASESITDEYLLLLKQVIEKVATDCSDAVIRGDNGDEVTNFTYNAMDRIAVQTNRLEEHTRRIRKMSTMRSQG